jgi:hypothetical protein
VAAIVSFVADPVAQADFWSAASGWPVARTGVEFASLRDPDGRGPWLEFIRSAHPHEVKNRIHLDVAPYPDGAIPTEVARLTDLGARPIDIGQGDVSWEVLSDPERNEFCVLTPR